MHSYIIAHSDDLGSVYGDAHIVVDMGPSNLNQYNLAEKDHT